MTPDARAQVAREVLTELAEAMGAEGNGGGGRVLRFRDEQFPPPSPVPPPIPLGAVVEVAGDEDVPYTRNAAGWRDCSGYVWRDADQWGRASLITALYHARREAEELREQVRQYEEREAARCPEDVGFAERIATLERERDEARRELAAQKETANSLISENAAEKENAPASAPRRCRFVEADGTPSELYEWGANSPAPASAPCGHTNTSPSPDSPHARVAAPRRWWLRRRSDAGWPDAHAYLSEEMARSARYGPTGGGWSDVVPVLEARVTRATVERVARLLRDDWAKHVAVSPWDNLSGLVQDCYRSNARAALTALGLTVEDDHA